MMLLIWGVACRIAGGCREALAACVIFFATLPVFGLTRFILPETLFVTFTLLSLLFLYQGWVKPCAPFSLFAQQTTSCSPIRKISATYACPPPPACA